jgi:hypothetical protein
MTSSSWHISGVSVQGTSHLEKNTPCQDAHACLETASGDLILAIADGAGSAERSQEGSQVAVRQVAASIQSLLEAGVPDHESDWQTLLTQAFSEALQSIVQLAEADEVPVRAFATTLACAVLSGDWLAVGQIGDGAVVVEKQDGALTLTARPQRGEYANEAYFLTMPDGLQSLAFYISQQPIRSLILTTDGLLRLAFKLPDYEPSPNFFQPLLTFNCEATDREQAESDLAAFLNSARLNARTDDDKTLVLATRVDPTGSPSERPVGETKK